jgi:hypothetical protein
MQFYVQLDSRYFPYDDSWLRNSPRDFTWTRCGSQVVHGTGEFLVALGGKGWPQMVAGGILGLLVGSVGCR